MKWFKHETDAIHSEKLTRLINEFGFEGYGRFWRIMEIVAERMDVSDRCHAELPEKEWLRLCRGTRGDTRKTPPIDRCAAKKLGMQRS